MFSVRSLTSEAISRDLLDRVFGELEVHAFGFEQRFVLFDQRVLGLGQNAHEIVFA